MTDRRKAFSYIVTFRDDGARMDNLLAVLDLAAGIADTEILLAEQGGGAGLDPGQMPASVRHLRLANPGPFNKSWGFNVCAKQALGRVLAFADADIVLDRAVVEACFDACLRTHQAINPYTRLMDLDPAQTRAYLDSGRLPADGDTDENRLYKGEHLCFCGGLYFIRKDDYLRLGGQDEAFRGWGGEDDAMSIKIGLLDSYAENRGGVAYHLFHPTSPQRTADEDYRRNVALLNTYRHKSREDLWDLCARHRRTMGDARKYA